MSTPHNRLRRIIRRMPADEVRALAERWAALPSAARGAAKLDWLTEQVGGWSQSLDSVRAVEMGRRMTGALTGPLDQKPGKGRMMSNPIDTQEIVAAVMPQVHEELVKRIVASLAHSVYEEAERLLKAQMTTFITEEIGPALGAAMTEKREEIIAALAAAVAQVGETVAAELAKTVAKAMDDSYTRRKLFEQPTDTMLAYLAEGSGFDAEAIRTLAVAISKDGGMQEAFDELVERGGGE